MRFRSWVLSFIFSCTALSQGYTISTFAGGPPHPAAQANKAAIGNPVGVTVDGGSNVYFFSRNCLFKVDPTGVMTRIAGNYTAGYSGDGGPATSAQIHGPLLLSYYGNISQDFGLAVDRAGNIYIPDPVANVVRKVSAAGIITTAAGNGSTYSYAGATAGDGGQAVNASLNEPHHVAIDAGGNLYIAEQRVRKVTPDGKIQTVPGNIYSSGGLAVDSAGYIYVVGSTRSLVQKFSQDGSVTTVAQLPGATDLALDAGGNLYVSDNAGYYIRKVSPNGTVSTVAGNGNWGFGGDSVPALGTPVAPEGLAADAAGNLYVADFDAGRVRKIDAGGTISTVAGNGGQWFEGDGGPAVSAVLSSPGPIAVDQAGNVYIADRLNNRIRKVAPDGTITTVAGTGSDISSGDGGPAVNAGLVYPMSLTFDGAGNLYGVDLGGWFRKIAPGGIITTVPGGPSNFPPPAPAFRPLAAMNTLVANSKGTLYFTSRGIQSLSPDGTLSYLGQLTNYFGGLALDGAGTLYYSLKYDNAIGKLFPTGQFGIVTITNGCTSGGFVNFSPYGPAIDRAGNVFVADPQGAIRRIAPSGIMETIAGNFTSGYSGDGGPATTAQLAQPTAIAVDAGGNIYIPDPIDNVVRVLRPSPAPLPVSVAAVTNGASNLAGPVAPGEIVVLYGAGLGPTPLTSCESGTAAGLVSELNDTQVFVNGSAAPLVYTSTNQVAAVVPYGVALGAAQVSVAFQNGKSATFPVTVNTSAPGIFTADGSGNGQAAAVNQNGSINGPHNPAKAGQYISLYATGEGQTSPAGMDGRVAQNPLPHPILPVTVTIGSQTVQPQYAGAAPGYFAGLMQVNAQIPPGTPPGTISVTIQVGQARSQAGVTITVN